jgi:tetratricopeptide (TPR) repeat protein
VKQANIFTIAFVVVTVLVAAALIWQACNFVDSLHKNVQAASSIRRQEETKIPEAGKFDSIAPQFSSQIDGMSKTHVMRPLPGHDELKGSEADFEKGLLASNAHQYLEAVMYYTHVLALVSEESKTRTSWFADSKFRDKRKYLSLTYESRAFCYLHLKHYRPAVLDLDEAIKLRPDYGGDYVNRGKAHMLLGEPALGQADLDRARNLPAAAEEDAATEHTLDDFAGH